MPDIDDIDACAWLLLTEVGEPSDNTLRLKIALAQPADAPGLADNESDHGVADLLATATRIAQRPGGKIVELTWPSYIAYSIRNESFVGPDAYAQFVGKHFVRFSRSHYLDFVTKATFASADYPGPFVHYGIYCLNHIIDVVSVDAPVVL